MKPVAYVRYEVGRIPTFVPVILGKCEVSEPKLFEFTKLYTADQLREAQVEVLREVLERGVTIAMSHCMADEIERSKTSAVRAAPSSEEVREMVERLRNHLENVSNDMIEVLEFPDVCLEAATLIERLAARVPDDCVVVPWEPTESMIGNERDRNMFTEIWKAMIAAGEVKP